MTRPPLMMNPFCLACWKHSMIHHYTHCTTSGPKNWNGAKSRQGRTFSFFLLLFWSHLMLVRYRLIALRCWSSTNLGLENDEPLIFVRLQKEHIVEKPLKKSHSAILRWFCIFSLLYENSMGTIFGDFRTICEKYNTTYVLMYLLSRCIWLKGNSTRLSRQKSRE